MEGLEYQLGDPKDSPKSINNKYSKIALIIIGILIFILIVSIILFILSGLDAHNLKKENDNLQKEYKNHIL